MAMAMAMAMAKDIQPETHWSKAHSTWKQWETKEERAIGGGDGDQQKLVEERLMRGRKIDQMRGRKKELYAEREREGAES